VKSKTELLAIVGPTASGKTDLGLRLARENDGEIISVDSRQVYRDLSIGTAKPAGAWVQQIYRVQDIPYHLVDFQDPDNVFSAADFVQQAEEKMTEIRARGKRPILVGGTGLYFKALVEGLAPLPPSNKALRAGLKTLAEKKGRTFLHAELAKADPEAAQRIPANNIHRVIRALEVYELTQKPISQWHREHQANLKQTNPSPPPSPLSKGRGNTGEGLKMIGIEMPREDLHRRIEKRCADMLKNGMIDETERLLKKGFAPDCPALTGLGYKRVTAFLNGRLSREDLLALLTQDTRQYAKRQMTWFRHQAQVTWKTL